MRSSPMMISRLPTAKRTKCLGDSSSVSDAAKTISAKKSRRSDPPSKRGQAGAVRSTACAFAWTFVAPVAQAGGLKWTSRRDVTAKLELGQIIFLHGRRHPGRSRIRRKLRQYV